MMKRVVNIAKNFKEAEEWDIIQQINLTPKERLRIVKELKNKVFGNKVKDLRKHYNKRKGDRG
jgi:hypothetical protein